MASFFHKQQYERCFVQDSKRRSCQHDVSRTGMGGGVGRSRVFLSRVVQLRALLDRPRKQFPGKRSKAVAAGSSHRTLVPRLVETLQGRPLSASQQGDVYVVHEQQCGHEFHHFEQSDRRSVLVQLMPRHVPRDSNLSTDTPTRRESELIAGPRVHIGDPSHVSAVRSKTKRLPEPSRVPPSAGIPEAVRGRNQEAVVLNRIRTKLSECQKHNPSIRISFGSPQRGVIFICCV